MGSTSGGDYKGIDFSVGGLVWVRQRNGAWWPGKILSPDELPDGCITTPKSGTPLKLIGKKGTTVHWFNLEKSKRVKAFHCGEYEDCIEKAKSSSRLSNKGVRKARWEDAILQALELESAFFNGDHPKISATPNIEEEEDQNQATCSSRVSDPEQHATKSLVQYEGKECAKNECEKLKTSNDSEEDGVGAKRMRGLEDLGVSIPSSLKRKRSHVAHEFLKRKSRRRPLTKVLQSSTMLSSPLEQFPYGNGLSDGVAFDNKVETMIELDSNGVLSDNGNKAHQKCEPKDEDLSCVQGSSEFSQSLFDVPLLSDDKMPTVVSDAYRGEQFETLSVGTEEKNECGSTSSSVHQINLTTEKATSEWQSKGKRNSRLRKVDLDDENISKESLDGSKTEMKRSLPCRLSRYTVNPKYDAAEFSLRHHQIPSSCLYNVVIEVKSSYQTQHVPYISLMSKMNNVPITGHPLTIEVLKDGACDDLVGFELTRPRVRPSRSRARKSGNLSKKTRKLSSFTGSKGLSHDEVKKPVMENLTVACIPLRVVFSRINAALSSSFRASPRLFDESIVV